MPNAIVFIYDGTIALWFDNPAGIDGMFHCLDSADFFLDVFVVIVNGKYFFTGTIEE